MSDAIYIEDGTGRQLAAPEDSRTGGSIVLKGNDASRWREANPDKVLAKEAAKTEDKAVAGPAKKAAAKTEGK
jgi:hypothetical protein